MDIKEVEKIARKLMRKHHLYDYNWDLKFSKSLSWAGRCKQYYYFETKTNIPETSGVIELSIDYMKVYDEKEVVETILHEIAHGRTDPKYRPHGPEWKAFAKSIGSTGERCVSPTAPKPDHRYEGVCVGGHKFARHKKTWIISTRNQYCLKCTKKMSKGEFASITWKDTRTGVILNPEKPVVKSVPVKVAAKAPKTEVGKVVDTSKPRELSWKEKYDAGMTSFDNDW